MGGERAAARVLRERAALGWLLRLDDHMAEQLHVSAVRNSCERFVNGERRTRFVAATAAFRA
jgi:hypothetical protein